MNRRDLAYKRVIVDVFIAKIVQAFAMVLPKLRAHRR
jgi:hypothetical protein